MAVYKEDSGNWYVSKRYIDLEGKKKRLFKRGFKTKREALVYEQSFMSKEKDDQTMLFDDFVEVYYEELKNRIRLSTFITKQNIIEKNIRPYFKDLQLSDITPKVVMRWQNKLMNKTYSREDKKYSPETLKTIHSQLSAILNHACKYYGLKMNAAAVAGNIKVEQKKEKEFWTFEEYSKFIDAISDKTLSYISYEILFWCGLRLGELRALTKADIDLEAKTINVNKSMQTIKGKNIVTDPKTSNSIRVVDMPDFIVDELRNYMDHLYKVGDDDYLFPVSKSYMHHEMDRGCKKSGVKRIRVHGLRHSHITMLIENGFSAKDVGKRVGHSAEKITYLYAHSYDERGKQMANKLDAIEGGDDESKGSR